MATILFWILVNISSDPDENLQECCEGRSGIVRHVLKSQRKLENISVGMLRSFRGNHSLESSRCVVTSPGCTEFIIFLRFSGRIGRWRRLFFSGFLSTFHRIPTTTYQECCEFVTKLCEMFSSSSESLRTFRQEC